MTTTVSTSAPHPEPHATDSVIYASSGRWSEQWGQPSLHFYLLSVTGRRFTAEDVYAASDSPLPTRPMIPDRELWLWRNASAADAVQRGIEQLASGLAKGAGSFAQFADLPDED